MVFNFFATLAAKPNFGRFLPSLRRGEASSLSLQDTHKSKAYFESAQNQRGKAEPKPESEDGNWKPVQKRRMKPEQELTETENRKPDQ